MEKIVDYITNPLFLTLILFVVILLTYNILQRLGRSSVWKQIADETGLQFTKHRTATYRDQQLSGIYRKRQLTLIESESEDYHADQHRRSRTNNSNNIDTEIKQIIDISQDIKMRVERIITIGEATKVTGDAEIDRHFNITSEPDWLAKKVFTTSKIRQKLSRIKMGSSIFIKDGKLLYNYPGIISDGKYIRFLFEFLSDLAETVEASTINVS
jgi:hypothetical protein